jgi:uncharacterized protein
LWDTYNEDKVYVGLGNTPQQAFENYLLKASGVSPIHQGNQTMLDVSDMLGKLRQTFSNVGLSLIKPILVLAPLTFKEADTCYLFNSDFANAQMTISKFLKDFGSWGDGRIFEWETDNKVNYGVIKEVNGITENHYVSIEVG